MADDDDEAFAAAAREMLAAKSDYAFDVPLTTDLGDVVVRPWQGGLSAAALKREADVATREGIRVYRLLKAHPDWPAWRRDGQIAFAVIMAKAVEFGGDATRLLSCRASDANELATGRNAFRELIDAVFGIQYPMLAPGGEVVFMHAGPRIRLMGSQVSQQWRSSARSILRELGLPLDIWHQRMALALIVGPPSVGITAAAMPTWIEPPGEGETDLERQYGAFVGAPAVTERAGVKAKQALRRLLGFQPPRQRPGRKPGTVTGITPDYQKLDRCLHRLSEQNISAEFISENAEAQALYRKARREPTAVLTPRIVRRRLSAQSHPAK
jgi:hypothetical protein